MSKLVKLLNRGKSTIQGTHHADGRKYAFRPNTAAAFHEVDAKKLQRLYPYTIQSLEDVQRTFDDRPADRKTSAAPAPDAPPPAAPVEAPAPVDPTPAAPAPVTPPPADPVAPAAPADGSADGSGQGDPSAA